MEKKERKKKEINSTKPKEKGGYFENDPAKCKKIFFLVLHYVTVKEQLEVG